jgi:hypothetical protein
VVPAVVGRREAWHWMSLSNGRVRDAYQTPPAAGFLSNTTTSMPFCSRCAAETTPLIPAPITATLRICLRVMGLMSGLYVPGKVSW